MKKILLILFYFVPCVCCAQLTEKINRHFVIAIDGAPAAPYISCLKKEDVSRKAIEKALAEFNVTDKDRVSLVSFAVSLSYPDFKSFAYIPNGVKGGRLYYKKISGADLSSWGDWEDIVYSQPKKAKGTYGENMYASFLSGSKPYIMNSVCASDKVGANETILLMLSDQDVNSLGSRWEDEWRDMSQAEGSNISPLFPKVQTFIKSANEVLYFNEIKIGKQKYIKVSSGYSKNGVDLPYTIKAYRVKITSKPLQAIVTMPTPLPVKRVRGGYMLMMDVVSNDSSYVVEKMELEVVRTRKKIQLKEGENIVDIDKSDFAEGDKVVVRAWVRYKDGFYNGIIMNPYDPVYKGALNISQTVEWCGDMKIMGMFPLYDIFWWWFPNDIFSAVMVWNLIILLIVIFIAGYIFYRCFVKINTYIPSNDKITINKTK